MLVDETSGIGMGQSRALMPDWSELRFLEQTCAGITSACGKAILCA